MKVRNKLVPAKRRAQAGQGATWRALPQEDLKAHLAASAVRRRVMTQTMPKDQWDLEKKYASRMSHQLRQACAADGCCVSAQLFAVGGKASSTCSC